MKKKQLQFKHIVLSAESFPEFADMLTKHSAELEIEKILRSTSSTLDHDDMERAVYNREESDKHDEVKCFNRSENGTLETLKMSK